MRNNETGRGGKEAEDEGHRRGGERRAEGSERGRAGIGGMEVRREGANK